MKKRFIALMLAAATCLGVPSVAMAKPQPKDEIVSHYAADDDIVMLGKNSLKTMTTSSGTRVWNVTVKEFVNALRSFGDYSLDDLKKVKDKNVFYQKYRDATIYFYGTSKDHSKAYLKKVVVTCDKNASDRSVDFTAAMLGSCMLIFSYYDTDDALDLLDDLEMDEMDFKTSTSASVNTAKFKLSYPSKSKYSVTITPIA